uniref:CCHC-type domain-containing protein n=1 Tax=Biomphalaria glabrata TaxID=6526 RepID=A0A2C9LHS6_BIOGL
MSSYDKILELVKVMELEGDEKMEFIKKELEKEETLENYLVQFEHISSTYNLNNEDMTKNLLANLSGEPLNIISTLTAEQKKEYTSVKNRLLEHFGKSEDHYRKLFKSIKLNKEGEFYRIIFDMIANMLKWLELAKCDLKDPTQILDMILIDNDSHPGHIMDKKEIHQLVATATTPNINDKFKFSNTKTCFNCGKRGHVKNQCRYPELTATTLDTGVTQTTPTTTINNQNNNNYSRYYRSNQSASPRERRSLRNNNFQYNNYSNNRQSRRDTYNYHTNNNSNNYQNRKRNNRVDNNGNNTNVHRVENVAYTQSDKSKINVFPSYVNSVEVRAIRDSGATASIVNAKL